jgi:hypothetical protein
MADQAALAVLVLDKVAAVLKALSEEQLSALLDGTGDLVFVSGDAMVRPTARRAAGPRAAKPAKPAGPGVAEVAARLPQLTDLAQAREYLKNTKLTNPDMRAVAQQLTITVQSKANKDQIIEALVQGTVGYKVKFDAVLGGSRER